IGRIEETSASYEARSAPRSYPTTLGLTRSWDDVRIMSASPQIAGIKLTSRYFALGRVEDGRGSLGHLATLRFPSSLIEPDVPISGIRLSDWFHREAHSVAARGKRSRRSRRSSP